MAIYNAKKNRLKNDLDIFKRYDPKTLKTKKGNEFVEIDKKTNTIIDPITKLPVNIKEEN